MSIETATIERIMRPNPARRRAKLRLLVKEAGNAAELSRLTGIREQQFSHWETGVRTISNFTASRLEAARGKPPGWMDFDDDPEASAGDPVTRKVPLIAWANAGRRGESMQFNDSDAASWVVHTDVTLDQRAFALKVRGDSMENSSGEPSFPEGCIIVVDPSVEAAPGDHVIVQLTTATEAVFKTLEFDGQLYFLKPLNSRYPISPMPADARVVGVVVEVQNHKAIVPRSRL